MNTYRVTAAWLTGIVAGESPMTLLDLLISLDDADLSTDGEDVLIWTTEEPTAEQVAGLRTHKAALLGMLSRRPPELCPEKTPANCLP